MVNRLIPVKIKLSMPWTETSMHFSSQCLNQGVKIFLGFFFIVVIFIVCLEQGKKKKAAPKLPWVTSGSGCVCTNPSPLLWDSYNFMSAWAGLCGSIFSGKKWFLYQFGYIFPSGRNFPFSLGWRCVAVGRGTNVLRKHHPEQGSAGILCTEFNVDFSWEDACLL